MWQVAVLLLLAGMVALAQPAFAQGCSLCYTQASQSGSHMIQALKSGILILVVPPTLLTLAMVRVCYKKKDDFAGRDSMRDDEEW